jgi:hypothetical protein
MLKADPSILQSTVRRLAWNVWRNCVCRIGLMGVGSGHMIFEHNRGDEDFTDTRN